MFLYYFGFRHRFTVFPGNVLGQGAFGLVYSGTAHHLNTVDGPCIVAIKQLKGWFFLSFFYLFIAFFVFFVLFVVSYVLH